MRPPRRPTTPPTTSATGTTGTTGTTGNTPTSTSPTPATDETTAAPADTTAADSTGTGDTICGTYAGVYADCTEMSYDDALTDCMDYTAMLDGLGLAGCVEGFEAYLVCLSALACEDFNMDDACMAEFDAYGETCMLE